MSARVPVVQIHYLRPPDREQVFRQLLVHDTEDVKVTLARSLEHDPPVVIGGRPVLETGSDAVWFTFPGLWHDIGRFHRADGTFTGIYANVITPPVLGDDLVWETTDLFLDLWLGPEGGLEVLDRDQLQEAEERGWIDRDTSERARWEAERIERDHRRGAWPPPVVEAWTRERALRAASE